MEFYTFWTRYFPWRFGNSKYNVLKGDVPLLKLWAFQKQKVYTRDPTEKVLPQIGFILNRSRGFIVADLGRKRVYNILG